MAEFNIVYRSVCFGFWVISFTKLNILLRLKIGIFLYVLNFFYNSPKVHRENPLKALVFDSTFDQYRGVIANIALFDGVVSKGDKIVSAHTKKAYEVNEVGILNPNEQPTHKL